MRDLGVKKIRVELHCHTCASKDSLVKPERLLQLCEKKGIQRIAITDHNAIKTALEMKNLAPERVIVGEEIETSQGELIGYFMSAWVPPGLSPLETIQRLRDQGAVISVPHPFDKARGPQWTEEQLEMIAPYVDAIETFNARCLNNQPNIKAKAYAKAHRLLETVGSDAHSLWEVGRASLKLPDFNNPEEFKAALMGSEPLTRLSPAFVHLFSRYAVLRKRLTKQEQG
jgi:predicted metal-dependent phosphoesterase TrpH